MSWRRRLDETWYRPGPITWLLLPLSWLYCLLVAIRRRLYRRGILRRHRVSVPVIVVGNITAGGSGKTPLIIWLARHLRERGYRPGIVTRGYGGNAASWPQVVTRDSDPGAVGDEPVLIARRADCPVIADPDRVQAARLMVTLGCDLILSDDGLQHYRLARDIEIAVIDGERRFGNGFCLPAGPLREPVGRLKTVDLVVVQGEPSHPGESGMELTATGFCPVADGLVRPLDAFRGQSVHAVAGIGNPGRFFGHLRKLDVQPIEHPFPDHHEYRETDLRFGDNLPVIMTEKDAVKCRSFPGPLWYLAVEAKPDVDFVSALSARLKEVMRG